MMWRAVIVSVSLGVAAGLWLQLIAGLRNGDASRRSYLGRVALAWWAMVVCTVVMGSLVDVCVYVAAAAFFTWLWWNNRPRGRGRRMLASLGDKSRALVRKLTRQITPAPTPSPAGRQA